MKVRVTLIAENEIPLNDIMNITGMSKEEIIKHNQSVWNIVCNTILKGSAKEKCTCEAVQIIGED